MFNAGAFSHRDRVGDPLLPAGDVRRVHRGAEPARGNGRELRGPGVRLRQLLRERRAERQQAFFFLSAPPCMFVPSLSWEMFGLVL